VQTTPSQRLAHLRDCGWFWAWVAVGVVFALGLDLPFLLPVAGALGVLVGVLPGSRRHIEGVIVGAGLPFLYVAYLNRQGPGTVCYSDGHGGGGCTDNFNPLPWLVIGLVLIVGGVMLYVRNQRRYAAQRS